MKVFLSSVISGFGEYRDAAAEAIASLGYEVVRSEDFQARPDTPQRACLGEVRSADVVVLILGDRYGAAQESGLSATHEEYREARDTRPILVFVQDGIQRDARQDAFVAEVEGWTGGALRAGFTNPKVLRNAVIQALHRFALSQAQGSADASEMLARAQALVGTRSNSSEGRVVVVIAGGPRQSVLRPTGIEDPDLAKWLSQALLFGDNAVFDQRHGIEPSTDGRVIQLVQRDRGLLLDAEGALRLHVPAVTLDRDRFHSSMALIEEDIRQTLARLMRMAGEILDHVDPQRRINRIAICAATPGTDYLGWQTRAEAAASRGSVRVSMSGSDQPVHLSPPDRQRAALILDADSIAEDLTILLKRARSM